MVSHCALRSPPPPSHALVYQRRVILALRWITLAGPGSYILLASVDADRVLGLATTVQFVNEGLCTGSMLLAQVP